jgi:hypothetical protein
MRLADLLRQRDATLEVGHGRRVIADRAVRTADVCDRAGLSPGVSRFPVERKRLLVVLDGQPQPALAGEDLAETGVQVSMLGAVPERGVGDLRLLEVPERLVWPAEVDAGPGQAPEHVPLTG